MKQDTLEGKAKTKNGRSNSFSGYEGWAKAIAHLYYKK